MIAVFQTEFGQIEVNTETKTAYIQSQDYEAPINSDGEFHDWFDRRFRFLMPLRAGEAASLDVKEWRRIGQITSPTGLLMSAANANA